MLLWYKNGTSHSRYKGEGVMQNIKPSFHAVREALRALAQAEGTDVALWCVTEALRATIESKETGGLSKVRGGIGKLLGIKSSLLAAPGQDHTQLFSRGGQPHLFLCQPYGIDLKAMQEIVAFCKANGLTASINGKTSDFIGRTIRLEYRKADSDDAQEQGNE
jgi:hypothetical protein